MIIKLVVVMCHAWIKVFFFALSHYLIGHSQKYIEVTTVTISFALLEAKDKRNLITYPRLNSK